MTKNFPFGKLALRVEGNWWVAYYAIDHHSMERSVELARLHMKHAEHPERRQQFMDLVQECVADVIEEVTGTRPEWNKPRPAPESERSGNA